MDSSEISQYDWLEASLISEAACLTLVTGADAATVAWAFGGHLEVGTVATPADVFDTMMQRPTAALLVVGDWILVVEINGWQGSRPEVLRRLTATGRAVSAYWSVNADTAFNYAVNGAVLTSFDAFAPDQRSGTEPDCLQALAADLPWSIDEASPEAVMLALAARVTGVRLDPAVLEGSFTVVPLVPWQQDVVDSVVPRYESLTHRDPELAYALARADPETQRRVALVAVRHAAEVAGLADDPAFAAVWQGEPQSEVLDRLAREWEPQERWPEFRTVEAARATTSPSPLAAAFRAITSAGYGIDAARADYAAFRAVLMAELGNTKPPSGSGGLVARLDGGPVGRFTWVDDHWLSWAACVTFVSGASVADVVTAFGGHSSREGAPPELSTMPVTWIRTVDDWVLVLEPGERYRPRQPLFERLSAGGVVVHLCWSSVGNSEFWYAVDGQVRTHFIAYAPDQSWGTDPHGLDRLIDELSIGADGVPLAAGMLALAQRLTSVGLAPQWLDEPWVRIPPQ